MGGRQSRGVDVKENKTPQPLDHQQLQEIYTSPYDDSEIDKAKVNQAIKKLLDTHRDVNPIFNARLNYEEFFNLETKEKELYKDRLLSISSIRPSSLVAPIPSPFFEASTLFVTLSKNRISLLRLYRKMCLSPSYFIYVKELKTETETRVESSEDQYNVNCLLVSLMGFMCYICLIPSTEKFKKQNGRYLLERFREEIVDRSLRYRHSYFKKTNIEPNTQLPPYYMHQTTLVPYKKMKTKYGKMKIYFIKR